MSFMFNFTSAEDSSGSGGETESKPIKDAGLNSLLVETNNASNIPAREVTQFCHEDLVSKLQMQDMEFGEVCLRLVDTSKMEKLILEDESFKSFARSKDLSCALSSNSDLVAGVYEGGLKIWECGVDMAEFLSSHTIGKAIDLSGKRVLELGCGAGIPGVYCTTRGALTVDFQDYNEEVLQLLTHTNVVNNMQEAKATPSRYFCGDWSLLNQLLNDEKLKYDVILSAETIYNTDNYHSLHDVFNTALSDTGTIIISAKVYYFGIGGSIDAFTEYVESEKCFTTETVHTIKAGVPRKILILRRRNKS